jgi:hypothetical protein
MKNISANASRSANNRDHFNKPGDSEKPDE